MRALLHQIIEHGQPAAAAQAKQLLSRIEADPDDADARADAEALVDAYLHDPHLTRYPPD
jgi:hypothetical protein